jgi:REP element-mobilizing transposase RayT
MAGYKMPEKVLSPAGTVETTMPHSYLSNLMHCVFSTKERHKFITPEMQQRLWPFIGGIAKGNGMKALAIGGVADHVHVLLSLPATMPVAKAMQLSKGGSSKFVPRAEHGTD